MPGLVEGAHEGTGLGMRFLRHIERTRVLVHFVDSSDYDSGMVERYKMIRNELERYGLSVSDKSELVAATKTDAAVPENLAEFEEFIKQEGKILFKICSLTKEGVKELLDAAEKILAETEKQNEEDLGAAGE